MESQTMHRQRKIILIAAAIGIISVCLPWATISISGESRSVNGFREWGILTFLMFVTIGVSDCLGRLSEVLKKSFRALIMLCGIVALCSVIIEIIFSFSSLEEQPGFEDIDFEMGIWLTIAASATIILFAWIFKSSADYLKVEFHNLKKSISIPATSISNTNIAKSSAAGKIAEFEKISSLRNNGSISEGEYQQIKSKLI